MDPGKIGVDVQKCAIQFIDAQAIIGMVKHMLERSQGSFGLFMELIERFEKPLVGHQTGQSIVQLVIGNHAGDFVGQFLVIHLAIPRLFKHIRQCSVLQTVLYRSDGTIEKNRLFDE